MDTRNPGALFFTKWRIASRRGPHLFISVAPAFRTSSANLTNDGGIIDTLRVHRVSGGVCDRTSLISDGILCLLTPGTTALLVLLWELHGAGGTVPSRSA